MTEPEERLRYGDRGFHVLAENLSGCVVRYDLNCMRIYVNPRHELLARIPAREALNQPLDVNSRADIRVEKYGCILKDVMRTAIRQRLVASWPKLNRERVNYVIRIVAEADLAGKRISMLAIVWNSENQNGTEPQRVRSWPWCHLADRIEIARDEERKNFARELHDEVGLHLRALRAQISALELESGKYDIKIGSATDRMIEIVDLTVGVVRNITSALLPSALETGIIAAPEWPVAEFALQAGVSCKFKTRAPEIAPSEKGSVGIFRIEEESLRSIVRHACAK